MKLELGGDEDQGDWDNDDPSGGHDSGEFQFCADYAVGPAQTPR
jgi:hypothetical protein